VLPALLEQLSTVREPTRARILGMLVPPVPPVLGKA
jgi:hypothetical protein